MKVLVYARNCEGFAKLAIECLLKYNKDIDIVLIDNASEDGLYTWASGTDNCFTYVYMDEGVQNVGKVLNDVIEALEIEEDFLILDAHMAVMPETIDRMRAGLNSNSRVGAVSSRANSFFRKHSYDFAQNYGEVLKKSLEDNDCQLLNTLGIYGESAMIKYEVYDKVGKFDEESENFYECIMIDYCLRMAMSGWISRIVKNAYVWDMRGNNTKIGMYHNRTRLNERYGMTYFNVFGNINLAMLIDAEPETQLNVLEIGCDLGATLLDIKDIYPNSRVYGVEINHKSVEIASNYLDIREGNIEDRNLDFGEVKFDVIIFGDVLEHLHDPLGTVEYCRKLLKDNGVIIASIPNLMHVSVMKQLLNGHFTYEDTGLLDKTHIHFFTYYEIENMFNVAGYKMENLLVTKLPLTQEDEKLINSLANLSEESTADMFETFQYVVRERKIAT